VSESKPWGTGTKVLVGVGVAAGLGYLLVKVATTSAKVGVAVGAVMTAAALDALAKAGVVVQMPESPPPAGAGSTLTTASGDALVLKTACPDGPAGCPFDGVTLAKAKALGLTFWGPA
jgi:hypothetical protein